MVGQKQDVSGSARKAGGHDRSWQGENKGEAQKNGQWDAPQTPFVVDDQIAILSEILREHELAFTNFEAMSPSVKKTYTRAYLDTKTDEGCAKRLAWIIERLNKNLKLM